MGNILPDLSSPIRRVTAMMPHPSSKFARLDFEHFANLKDDFLHVHLQNALTYVEAKCFADVFQVGAGVNSIGKG